MPAQLTNIAVIGARGQLGSELCLAAAALGLRVVALNRPEVDITDAGSVERALAAARPQVVFNTAAFHKVDECEAQPDWARQINCQGALNVARACAAVGAICAQVSTDYVFAGDGQGLLREGSPRAPLSIYGQTRAEAEDLVASSCPRHYIFRVAGLFGVASLGRGGNFIEKVLGDLALGAPLTYIGDRVGSATYAPDAATAMLEVLRRDLPFGTWHTVNAGACSWFDQAAAVARAVHSPTPLSPCRLEDFGFSVPRPRHCPLSVEKLALHGVDMPPWQDGLRRYLNQRGLL